MKQRILNPNSQAYKDYGGRGITICNDWLEFIPFRDWSLSNGYKDNLQINRMENDSNYEPSNCNFVTPKENSRNRRSTKISLEQANEIRILHQTGKYTQTELGTKYNISRREVNFIIHNKHWVDK